MEQLEESAEPPTKEKDGGTKRLRSEISTPSPSAVGLPKKQQMVEIQLFFLAHAVKAVKMAIVKEAFPTDKLSNDDFDHVHPEENEHDPSWESYAEDS